MIQKINLRPYLDKNILELGESVKVSEEAILSYLSTIVVVDNSLRGFTADEINEWFTKNHYFDPYFKKDFSSLSSYVNEYALHYVKEMGCDSFVMQKEDKDWMEKNKADFNTAFALLD